MKNILFNSLAALFVIMCISGTTQAAKIIVTNNQNDGSGSLRQAITTASDGDSISFSSAFTILLESELTLGDKSIVINGLVGDKKVRLDGNYKDSNNDTIDDDNVYTRIFRIVSSADFKITISNLIIQNGKMRLSATGSSLYTQGGGMYIDMTLGGLLNVAYCTIENNLITNCIESDNYNKTNNVFYGGGIFSVNGGVFNNCIIRNNTIIAKNFLPLLIRGGGIYSLENTLIFNCTIAGNKIESIINDSTIRCYSEGGGVYLGNTGKINNCAIIGNSVNAICSSPSAYYLSRGGGIYVTKGSVFNSVIANNSCVSKMTLLSTINGQTGVGGGSILSQSIIQNSILTNNYSIILPPCRTDLLSI